MECNRWTRNGKYWKQKGYLAFLSTLQSQMNGSQWREQLLGKEFAIFAASQTWCIPFLEPPHSCAGKLQWLLEGVPEIRWYAWCLACQKDNTLHQGCAGMSVASSALSLLVECRYWGKRCFTVSVGGCKSWCHSWQQQGGELAGKVLSFKYAGLEVIAWTWEYVGYLDRKHNTGGGKMWAWYVSTSIEHFRGAEQR